MTNEIYDWAKKVSSQDKKLGRDLAERKVQQLRADLPTIVFQGDNIEIVTDFQITESVDERGVYSFVVFFQFRKKSA